MNLSVFSAHKVKSQIFTPIKKDTIIVFYFLGPRKKKSISNLFKLICQCSQTGGQNYWSFLFGLGYKSEQVGERWHWIGDISGIWIHTAVTRNLYFCDRWHMAVSLALPPSVCNHFYSGQRNWHSLYCNLHSRNHLKLNHVNFTRNSDFASDFDETGQGSKFIYACKDLSFTSWSIFFFCN